MGDDERAQAGAARSGFGPGFGAGTSAVESAEPDNGEQVAAAEASETGLAAVGLDDIEGHVLRAIRYHEARAQFLDFWRRVFDFMVIVLGAGAVTAAAGEKTLAGTMIGIAVAGIGAWQLVAGFGERAGVHTSLKRRFCAVLADIVEARGEGAISSKRRAKITRKWAAIWADEPPTYHVLEAIAWNAARRAREWGLDEGSLIAIPWWQSLTRNLFTWESFKPLTVEERGTLPWYRVFG